MKLPIIIIAAFLTACAAPIADQKLPKDHCYEIRKQVETCKELLRLGKVKHCECTTQTSEPRDYHAPVAELPGGSDGGGVKEPPKPDLPPHDHNDGHGHDDDADLHPGQPHDPADGPDHTPEKYDD